MIRLGARAGRRIGAKTSGTSGPAYDPNAEILALSPFEDWFYHPDYLNSDYLSVGISAWTGRSSGLVLAEATSAARPTNLASISEIGGVAGASFRVGSPSQRLLSTAAASTWSFFHDGSGGALYVVCVRRLSSTNTRIAGTAGTGTALGFSMGVGAGDSARLRVGNGSAAIVSVDPSGAIAAGVGVCLGYSYEEALAPSEYRFGTSVAELTGNSTAAPGASASASSLCIGGAEPGSLNADVDIARVVVFDRTLSAGELTVLDAALTALYGVGL